MAMPKCEEGSEFYLPYEFNIPGTTNYYAGPTREGACGAAGGYFSNGRCDVTDADGGLHNLEVPQVCWDEFNPPPAETGGLSCTEDKPCHIVLAGGSELPPDLDPQSVLMVLSWGAGTVLIFWLVGYLVGLATGLIRKV